MSFLIKLFRFWFLLIFIFAFGYIAAFNQGNLQLQLPPFITVINLPIYAALAGAFLIGASITVVFFGMDHFRKAWRIRSLEKQVKAANLNQAKTAADSNSPTPSPTFQSQNDPQIS